MGNCLGHENKIVRVMKMDGKVLEYQTPLKVHEVLSEFTNHAISDTLSVHGLHLNPDTDMLGGRLYYLLPLPLPSKAANSGTMMASSAKGDLKEEDGVVKIKIIISKQELKEMVAQEGVLSLGEMLSHLIAAA